MANIKKREVVEVMDSDDTPEMDRIANRLSNLRSYLNNLTNRSRTINYRFFDTLYDEDCEREGPEDGIVKRLDYEIDLIYEVMSDLEKSLEKLSTL